MRVLRGSGFVLIAALILTLELGCGDTYRPVANPIIGSGGQPQPTYYAYVLNSNPNGNGTTMQIDVSGDTASNVTTQGLGSVYETIPAYSVTLYVANTDNDSITSYIPILSSSVITINMPVGSHPMFLNSAEAGSLFVLNSGPSSTCPDTGSIAIINTAQLTVTNTVCVGKNPVAMAQAANGGQIFVVNQGDNSVSVFDPPSQSVIKTFTTTDGIGANPVYAVSRGDGAYIYILCDGDGVNPGEMNIINTANFSQFGTVPLGVNPNYALFDPHLDRLYITNSGDNSVSVFDASNTNLLTTTLIPLLAKVTVGTTPVSVTALADGTRFYTANSVSNDVTAVSATSFQVLTTIPVGTDPVWIASDPGSSKVYTANKGSSSVSIIKTVNNTVTVTIPSPQQDPSCTSNCALQQPVMILAPS